MAVIDQAIVQLQAETQQFDQRMAGSKNTVMQFDKQIDQLQATLLKVAKATDQGSDEFRQLQQQLQSLSQTFGQFNTIAGQQAASGLSKTTSSIRNVGFSAQNAGYQISDFFVQIEMGTPLVRAFGQQFPQLISAFGILGGPVGIAAAAIGTLVAVGSALLSIFLDMRSEMEIFEETLGELEKSTSTTNDAFEQLAQSTEKAAGGIAILSQAQHDLLSIQLDVQLARQTTKVKELTGAFVDALEDSRNNLAEFIKLTDGNNGMMTESNVFGPSMLFTNFNKSEVVEIYNVFESFFQLVREQGSVSTEQMAAFGASIDQLRDKYEGVDEDFDELVDVFAKLFPELLASSDALKELERRITGIQDPIATHIQRMKDWKDTQNRLKTSELIEWFLEFQKSLENTTKEQKTYNETMEKLEFLHSRGVLTLEQLKKAQAEFGDKILNTTEKMGAQARAAGVLHVELMRIANAVLVDDFASENDSFTKLAESLDPLLRIKREYEERISTLNTAILVGNKLAADEKKWLDLIEAARLKAITALSGEDTARASLLNKISETIAKLRAEYEFQTALTEATREGGAAVNELTDAYEAETIIRQLRLDQLGLEETRLREVENRIRALVAGTNEAIRETQRYNEAQRELAASLKESARAAEEAAREFEAQVDDITNAIAGEFSSVYDDMEDGWDVALGNMGNRLIKFLADAAFEAAIRPVVVGVMGGSTGGMSSNFLSGASSTFSNPAGFLSGNLTQGSLGTNLFGTQGAFPGAFTQVAPYGMGSVTSGFGNNVIGGLNNLSSPLGIVGGMAGSMLGSAVFGGSNQMGSSIGGMAGSAIASIALMGTPLAPLAPFLGSFLGSGLGGMIGGGPSVGPTGVAITSDILGAGLPDMITGVDNGGSSAEAEATLQGISAVLRELTVSGTLSGATRRGGQFGLDVSYYSDPEAGTRSGGFGLNEIINGVKKELDLQGLSGEEVLFEGVVRTLRGAFETLGSSDLDLALQNTAATSLGQLLEDINFAEGFENLFSRAEAGMGPFESALENLRIQFETAKDKAIELGLATEGLTSRYSQSVADMTEGFAQSLRAETMGVGGEFSGLINLAATLQQLSSDAEAANVSTELLATVIENRLKAAIEGLAPSQIQSLATLFEAIRGSVAGAGIVSDFLSGQSGNTANPYLAYLPQYEEQYRATLDTIEELERNTDALKELGLRFRGIADSRLTNEQLSYLSPMDRLAEARSQLENANILATDGTDDPETRDAIQRLPQLEQTMLEASLAYYGKSDGYLQDFNRGQEILRGISSDTLSAADQQLDALREANIHLSHLATIITNLGGTVPGSEDAQATPGGAVTAPESIGGGTITANDFVSRQAAYIANNPDVAFGIQQGWFDSGYQHWNLVGQFEQGRTAFTTGGSFQINGQSGMDALRMPPVPVTAGEIANISRADTMTTLSRGVMELRDEVVGLRRDTRSSSELNSVGQQALLDENIKQGRAIQDLTERLRLVENRQPKTRTG